MAVGSALSVVKRWSHTGLPHRSWNSSHIGGSESGGGEWDDAATFSVLDVGEKAYSPLAAQDRGLYQGSTLAAFFLLLLLLVVEIGQEPKEGFCLVKRKVGTSLVCSLDVSAADNQGQISEDRVGKLENILCGNRAPHVGR